VLRAGNPLGERLTKVATRDGMLLTICDPCANERGLAEQANGANRSVGVVEGVTVGCFPDLYAELAGNPRSPSARRRWRRPR
jgi:sulfur relay (sulfurtransferase) complex TusBCD TusD component (DsrE family)